MLNTLRQAYQLYIDLPRKVKIPAMKVGNLWRFRKEKIDKWLSKGKSYKEDENHEQR